MKGLGAALCLVAATLAAPADATRTTPRYTSLTVFGDSLVDAGNISNLTGGTTPNPAQGYFMGRFTNGYDYTDLLSQALFNGASTVASRTGGTNFAYGGARATTTSGVPDAVEQLGLFNAYLAQPGHAVDPNGLYVLNFGGNDIFAAQNGTIPAGYTDTTAFLTDAAAKYAGLVQSLNDLGARNILVTGFPVLTSTFSAQAEGYLITDLAGLSLNANTTLYRFSYLDFFQRILTDPTQFGLPANLDTTGNCIAAGAQASGCAGYFSFDGTHPVAAVQTALFNDLNRQFALTASVPEPATWGMMIAGLGLAGGVLRRRARPAARALAAA